MTGPERLGGFLEQAYTCQLTFSKVAVIRSDFLTVILGEFDIFSVQQEKAPERRTRDRKNIIAMEQSEFMLWTMDAFMR